MPDHIGSLFQHKHSKLVQLNIYDINFNLIPTFHLSQSLKTGTVVMAKCTLHCYITPGDYKNKKVRTILWYIVKCNEIFLLDVSTKRRHDSYPRWIRRKNINPSSTWLNHKHTFKHTIPFLINYRNNKSLYWFSKQKIKNSIKIYITFLT